MEKSPDRTDNPTIRENEITFNIIYVENTVEFLLPFICSLLAHSTCSYRLVSNACNQKEEEILKEFVNSDDRLSFYSLKVKSILPHHAVLHQLLEIETCTSFAFMDSDIFSKGSFLPELMNALNGKDAVFTGLPLWHENTEMKMPEKFKIMGGRYFMSHNNHLLGLSYMAIYKTDSLKHFIKSTGVDFRRYYWRDIPVQYQDIISQLGLRKKLFDTAKVLNILWQYNGAKMVYHKVDNLIHLGGLSGEDNHVGVFMTMKRNLLRLIPSYIITSVKIIFGVSDRISFQERVNIERLVKKRRISSNLLRQRLYSHSIDPDMKTIHFLGTDIAQKFQKAIEVISPVVKGFYQNRYKK